MTTPLRTAMEDMAWTEAELAVPVGVTTKAREYVQALFPIDSLAGTGISRELARRRALKLGVMMADERAEQIADKCVEAAKGGEHPGHYRHQLYHGLQHAAHIARAADSRFESEPAPGSLEALHLGLRKLRSAAKQAAGASGFLTAHEVDGACRIALGE